MQLYTQSQTDYACGWSLPSYFTTATRRAIHRTKFYTIFMRRINKDTPAIKDGDYEVHFRIDYTPYII